MLIMTKDKILAALPSMKPADLKALQAVIGGLLADRPAKGATGAANPQAWLFEAMAAALNVRQSYDSFISSPAGKTFKQTAPVAVSFISDNFVAAMGNRATAQGLMRYLLGLLLDELKRMKVPATRNTVSQHLHRLPEIFEHAYPNYISSGMAPLVLLAITRGSPAKKNLKN
jgi:hypothetical protein